MAAIEADLQYLLFLGNLDAKRDWGHAQEYVNGMWLALQQDTPDDYVLATGKSYSVRRFAEQAFGTIGINLQWQDKGTEEQGVCAKTGRTLIKIDPRYFRPTEVSHLEGDGRKARQALGWQHTISFQELVKEMVEADRKRVQLTPKGRN